MSDGILLSEEFHQSCHTFTDGILPLRISISQMTDAFSTSRISISHVTEPFLEMLSHLKTAKMAMFEVIPRASWRSNSGSAKLGQNVHVGGVLKLSGPADSKSVPVFEN